MKTSIQKAVGHFQQQVRQAIPDVEVEVSQSLEQEDAAFVIYLPKREAHILEMISDILIETEDRYDVVLAYTPLVKQKLESAKS